MAAVLQIENYGATATLSLLSSTGVALLIGTKGTERPLKHGGQITRVFSFKASGATKALARQNANTFLSYLRNALKWKDDDLRNQSYFLREAADGETPTRYLIIDYQADVVEGGTAVDGLQVRNKEIFIDVAFTLQNHREKVSKTTLTESGASNNYAIGKRVLLSDSGNANVASRVFLTLTSKLFGSYMTRYWIGMRPHDSVADGTFLHLWYFDYADNLSAGTTEAISAGSHGNYIVQVTFSDNLMTRRCQLGVYDQYSAQSITPANQAKGRYIALLRYKSGSTVLARIGISGSETSPAAYNEPRLLDGSGNWRFANLGVIQFPPYSVRAEEVVPKLVYNCYINIDAQRLSGTPTLILDTITLIPYDHYLHVDSTSLATGYVNQIIVNEDLRLTARVIDGSGTFISPSNVVENNNFLYPFDDTSHVLMVYAAERAGSQVANDNLDNGTVTIFEAREGYYD